MIKESDDCVDAHVFRRDGETAEISARGLLFFRQLPDPGDRIDTVMKAKILEERHMPKEGVESGTKVDVRSDGECVDITEGLSISMTHDDID